MKETTIIIEAVLCWILGTCYELGSNPTWYIIHTSYLIWIV